MSDNLTITTMLAFSAIARPARLADQVVEAIYAGIRSGAFGPGARLPTEHVLAERLGVSRSVVREGLARLKADGMVESRQGAGLFVASNPSSANFHIDAHPSGAQLADAFELRLIVEVAAAELAAARRSAHHLSEMALAIASMDAAIADGRDGSDHDEQFHRAIAAASSNAQLARFVGCIGTAFRDTRQPSWSPEGLARGLPDAAQNEHRAILAAIRDGDVAAAGIASRRHLMQSAERTGMIERSEVRPRRPRKARDG